MLKQYMKKLSKTHKDGLKKVWNPTVKIITGIVGCGILSFAVLLASGSVESKEKQVHAAVSMHNEWTQLEGTSESDIWNNRLSDVSDIKSKQSVLHDIKSKKSAFAAGSKSSVTAAPVPATEVPATPVPPTPVPVTPVPEPAPQQEIQTIQQDTGRAAGIEDGNIISGQPVKRTPVVDDLDSGLRSAALEIYRQVTASTEECLNLTYQNLSEDEIQTIQKALINTYVPYYRNSQSLFSVDDRNTYHFAFPHLWKDAIAEQEAIMPFVEQIKSSNDFSGMTEKSAYLRVHDIVNDYLQYNYSDYYSGQLSSMIDVIHNRIGVCGDYSQLVQAICENVGISCRTCIGKAMNGAGDYGSHEWDQVKIGNGWYYSDPCWDDTTSSDDYLLSAGLWEDHWLNKVSDTGY